MYKAVGGGLEDVVSLLELNPLKKPNLCVRFCFVFNLYDGIGGLIKNPSPTILIFVLHVFKRELHLEIPLNSFDFSFLRAQINVLISIKFNNKNI